MFGEITKFEIFQKATDEQSFKIYYTFTYLIVRVVLERNYECNYRGRTLLRANTLN